jgi:hypothetical protein
MGNIKVEDKHLIVHENAFRKGLALQREHYKLAKAANNFRVMRNCLENLKMEIKQSAKANNEEITIRKIESVISWYDNLPSRFVKNGPEGRYVAYPHNYDQIVNKAFTNAYELIISLLERLDLL